MQILVVTDNHVSGSEGLETYVQSVVASALERFGNRVTRVEVHLGDENSHKSGGEWCAIEAKLAGLQPITVNDNSGNLNRSVDNAVEKLLRALEHAIGKKEDAKPRVSASREREL
jgi:ribosome-associated translation inhibitor RaiA